MFECSKNISCSFWSPACDGGALCLPRLPTVTRRLPAAGEPQSHSVGLLPFNASHSSAATPRDLPSLLSPTMNPSGLFTAVHRAFLWSQSPVHLWTGASWRCPEPEMPNISEQILLFPWDLLFGLFDPRGLQMNACFPPLCRNIWRCRSFATQSMAPRSTTSASLRNLLEMQSFELHPQPTDRFCHSPTCPGRFLFARSCPVASMDLQV